MASVRVTNSIAMNSGGKSTQKAKGECDMVIGHIFIRPSADLLRGLDLRLAALLDTAQVIALESCGLPCC
jgi:hypothetical protein